MVRLLTERAAKGVDVRIIGRVAAKKAPLTAQKYPGKRLHVRAIVRDGRHAFVGSQSLRKIELEKRREVGIIASEPGVVKQIQSVFEQDWALTESGEEGRPQSREGGKKRREGSRPRDRGERSVVYFDGAAADCRLTTRSCGDRQKSIVETRWTQPTVQYGAHDFGVANARRMSSTV